jgi:pimeloyl-[acyl-carrier protein] methyl ester esterase
MTPEAPPGGVDVFLGPDLPAIKAGSGARTLVLLPGLSLFPGHPTGQARRRAMMGWEPLYERYTVYLIGRRVLPVGTDFRDMADDVSAAIEGLDPPVDLLGASTGGVIALHVAATRPDLVRRLVLVVTGTAATAVLGPRLGGVSSDVGAGRWRRVYSQIFQLGARSRVERLAYRALGWVMGPRLVGIPNDPTIMLAELDAWARVDARDLVSRVTCPTLVVAGELDPIFPLGEARALADELTDGTLVVMPRVAHDFPVSAIATHIVPFLD